jgi:hypothetical protein
LVEIDVKLAYRYDKKNNFKSTFAEKKSYENFKENCDHDSDCFSFRFAGAYIYFDQKFTPKKLPNCRKRK